MCESLALMHSLHDVNKFCKNLVPIYIMQRMHERQIFAHSYQKENQTCLNNVHCESLGRKCSFSLPQGSFCGKRDNNKHSECVFFRELQAISCEWIARFTNYKAVTNTYSKVYIYALSFFTYFSKRLQINHSFSYVGTYMIEFKKSNMISGGTNLSSSSKFDFFGSSSSFSSTLGLGRKVRDVRSSMLKFDELFELVQATFWDRFGEKISSKR